MFFQKQFFILIVGLVSVSSLFSQKPDTLVASKLLQKANILVDSMKWDSAAMYYGQAAILWNDALINPEDSIISISAQFNFQVASHSIL